MQLALDFTDDPAVRAALAAVAAIEPQALGILDNLGGVVIMARLTVVDHSAVPDMLVAYFDAMPSEITLRLLAQRRGDARVRTKLEAIAADDADPKQGKQAASILRQAPPPLQGVPVGN